MQAGFIGLGAMGFGMARNLHRRGLLASVWNRTAARAETFAQETGARVAASPADLARECDIVVSCVSADSDLHAVIDAALTSTGKLSGKLFIDCSTISAQTARDAAAKLRSVGADFLDAPVSGGVEGARNGTLAIMVGGDEQQFERAQPVLHAMGKAVTRFGDVGTGQAAKATNQIMCAGVIQAVAEAMAFAQAEGLPLPALIDTLSQGAGSSWYFVHRAPNIVKDAYPPGFRVQLHEKDLRICREMAARHNVQLPLVEMTLLHYRKLIAQGHGDEDISTLFRLKQAMFQRGDASRGDVSPSDMLPSDMLPSDVSPSKASRKPQ